MLQAVSFVLLPVAILVGFLTKAPIGLAIAMFSPFLPIGVTMLSQLFGLSEFGRQYGKRPSFWHYLSILCLTPAYQIVLSAAAIMALYKFLHGDNTWYKTGRAASHREIAPSSLEVAA